MKVDDSDAQAPGPRRPYEPPAIEESSEFETLSLTCTHTAAGCDPELGEEPQS